jgi:hypothetical protein
MAGTEPDRGRPRRPGGPALALAAGALLVVGGAIAAFVILSGAPSASAVAPAAFYAYADGGDSHLVRVPLDGRTPASTIATHRQPLRGFGSWSISPGGDIAAWTQSGQTDADGDPISTVELSRVGSAEPLATVEIAGEGGPQVWSVDGRWLAGTTLQNEPDGSGETRAFVIEVSTGLLTSAIAPRQSTLVGLTANGRLVLAEFVEPPDGEARIWTFHGLAPGAVAVAPLDAASAQTEPGSTLALEVNARLGGYVQSELIDAGPAAGPDADPLGHRIVLRELAGGAAVELARVGLETEYDSPRVLPDGSAIIVAVRGQPLPEGGASSSLSLVGLDGRISQLWAGDFPPLDTIVAAEGDLIGLSGWTERMRLVVVDLQTGVSVELPLAADVRDATLLRVVGGARIPAESAIAPTPVPTAAPPTPVTPALSGAPRVFAVREATDPTGTRIAELAVVAPAANGAVTIVDSLPPIELGGGDDGGQLIVVAAPDGRRALVVVVRNETLISSAIWEPGAPAVPLQLPPGWPAFPAPVWRPDGGALATTRDEAVWWFEIGDAEATTVPIPAYEPARIPWYVDPAGWTADGDAVVLGPSHCTEGCGFSYPTFARLDLATGDIVPYAAGSSVDAVSSNALGTYASVRTGEFAFFPDTSMTLTVDYGNPRAARAIAWPATAGTLEQDIAQPVWSADGSRLYLQSRLADGSRVFRLDAPIPASPKPVEIGRMADGWALREVAPGEAWAIVARAGFVPGFLDLASGTVHELADDWTVVGFAAVP